MISVLITESHGTAMYWVTWPLVWSGCKWSSVHRTNCPPLPPYPLPHIPINDVKTFWDTKVSSAPIYLHLLQYPQGANPRDLGVLRHLIRVRTYLHTYRTTSIRTPLKSNPGDKRALPVSLTSSGQNGNLAKDFTFISSQHVSTSCALFMWTWSAD